MSPCFRVKTMLNREFHIHARVYVCLYGKDGETTDEMEISRRSNDLARRSVHIEYCNRVHGVDTGLGGEEEIYVKSTSITHSQEG